MSGFILYTLSMNKINQIALVAHDNRKKDLIEWVEFNWKTLLPYNIFCTGTTGSLVEESIKKKISIEDNSDQFNENSLNLTKLKSGPLGGDQQLGALIAEGKIDMMIFLWDPMEPQPHDVDVKALARIAVLYNIPIANNRATADFLISSPLLNSNYEPILKNYSDYIHRKL